MELHHGSVSEMTVVAMIMGLEIKVAHQPARGSVPAGETTIMLVMVRRLAEVSLHGNNSSNSSHLRRLLEGKQGMAMVLIPDLVMIKATVHRQDRHHPESARSCINMELHHLRRVMRHLLRRRREMLRHHLHPTIHRRHHRPEGSWSRPTEDPAYAADE